MVRSASFIDSSIVEDKKSGENDIISWYYAYFGIGNNNANKADSGF